jgi:uncharacterized membrane-anchored protein
MNTLTPASQSPWLNKVPAITLAFWVIKIMSTTVGETGADYLAVNAGFGQGMTRAVMGALLAMALFMQLRTQRHIPWIYWLTVVLVSVVGTQITDLLTDGLGVSLHVSTSVFAAYRMGGNAVLTFWLGYILTRPFGAALGDLLTQAKTDGGLAAPCS